MQYVMKKRKKLSLLIAILLLTLILHLLFLYFFTTIQFSYGKDIISDLLSKLTSSEKKELAQLQSHAPQQSAPVIFRDEPEEKKESVKQQTPPPEPPQTLVAHSMNSYFANPGPQARLATPDAAHIKEEQTKKLKKEKNTDNQSVPRAPRDERSEEETTPAKEKPKTKKQKLENTMLTQDGEIQESEFKSVRPDLSAEALAKGEVLRDLPISAPVRRSLGEGGKDRAATRERTHTSSKTLSLADLSEKYMQKISTTIDTPGGYGSMHVQGAAYGHPSAYQIALERYVGKMCKEIETAYRIHTNQSIQSTQHKPFLLAVELNANGGINTIYASESSGVARIDEFAMSVFQSASKSFPKLPEAMGTYLRIQFGINHIDHMAYLSRGGTLSMR